MTNNILTTSVQCALLYLIAVKKRPKLDLGLKGGGSTSSIGLNLSTTVALQVNLLLWL